LPDSQASSETPKPEIDRQKDRAIIQMLAQLSLLYWRPEFTPELARELYAMYVDDLRSFPIWLIERSIQNYRRDGKNRFFPTSGQIIDGIKLIEAQAKEAASETPRDLNMDLMQRPIQWWLLRREHWQPHWREDEIPKSWFDR